MSETLRLTPTSIDPELTVDAIEAERQRQVVVRQALTQELPVEVTVQRLPEDVRVRDITDMQPGELAAHILANGNAQQASGAGKPGDDYVPRGTLIQVMKPIPSPFAKQDDPDGRTRDRVKDVEPSTIRSAVTVDSGAADVAMPEAHTQTTTSVGTESVAKAHGRHAAHRKVPKLTIHLKGNGRHVADAAVDQVTVSPEDTLLLSNDATLARRVVGEPTTEELFGNRMQTEASAPQQADVLDAGADQVAGSRVGFFQRMRSNWEVARVARKEAKEARHSDGSKRGRFVLAAAGVLLSAVAVAGPNVASTIDNIKSLMPSSGPVTPEQVAESAQEAKQRVSSINPNSSVEELVAAINEADKAKFYGYTFSGQELQQVEAVRDQYNQQKASE